MPVRVLDTGSALFPGTPDMCMQKSADLDLEKHFLASQERAPLLCRSCLANDSATLLRVIDEGVEPCSSSLVGVGGWSPCRSAGQRKDISELDAFAYTAVGCE
jgi:hypothetical protein